MRRSAMSALGAVIAVVTGCGALVGVQDLEVTGDANVTSPDGGTPERDGGEQTPADGGPEDEGRIPAKTPQRPPAGSYVYTITGGDQLKKAYNANRPYGAKKATVDITHDPADEKCFTEVFTFRDDYTETMVFCLDGTDYKQTKGSRKQRFDVFANASTDTTCTPGDTYFPLTPTPAQTWPHNCTGENSANTQSNSGGSKFTTIGTYTFVGQEVRTVASTNVDVLHFHDDRTVDGEQKGPNVSDWYIAVKNGVLVRLTRNIDLQYSSFIGAVEYVEQLDMTIDAPP